MLYGRGGALTTFLFAGFDLVHDATLVSPCTVGPLFSSPLGILCQQRWASRAARSGSNLKLRYEGLVAAGELKFDPHQIKAVEQMQRLRNELDGYELASPGLMQRVSP